MSIRPADMQAMVQQSGDIARMNNSNGRGGNMSSVMQQQFAEQFQKEVKIEDRQIAGMKKAEGGRVDKDREKAPDKRKKRRDKADKGGGDTAKDGKKPGKRMEAGDMSILDIRV